MDLLANGPSRHARHVFEVVRRGVAPDTPERIAGSWSRCVRQYGLDPLQAQIPPTLGHEAVEERRRRMADLVECAELEMFMLHQQLGDSDAALVLTDAEGVVLHIVSAPELGHDLAEMGLRTGAIWSEEKAGTNGMGTCIAARAPVAVRRSEHFFASCAALTCSAAPIFDPQGALLAVLDITSRSQQGQQYALVLVNGAAQRIENRLLDLHYRNEFPIHFHSRAELVHTLHEGRLVVAPDGLVRAANRRALTQLGMRTPGDIAGRKVEDLFGADLREILERSYGNSFRPVATRGAAATFFITAQQPITAAAPHRVVRAQVRPRSESAAPRVPEFGDPSIGKDLATARRLVERRIPILLHGETGVGKEIFARALHRLGPLADGEFVPLDCAALRDGGLQALFEGAPRNARSSRPSRARSLAGARGTIFLDAVGHLSPDAQSCVLHGLNVLRAAGPDTDFQIVSASHRSLSELVRRGEFRDDLYYLLCGVELEVPPLRARSDVAGLIRRILADEIGASYELEPEAERLLLAYPWPGNVRQLHHVLHAAAALADGTRIGVACLPGTVRVPAVSPASSAGTPGAPVEAPQAAASGAVENAPEDPRAAMLRTLEQHRWNMSRVAATLQISRNTLYRRLHRLNIDLPY